MIVSLSVVELAGLVCKFFFQEWTSYLHVHSWWMVLVYLARSIIAWVDLQMLGSPKRKGV